MKQTEMHLHKMTPAPKRGYSNSQFHAKHRNWTRKIDTHNLCKNERAKCLLPNPWAICHKFLEKFEMLGKNRLLTSVSRSFYH